MVESGIIAEGSVNGILSGKHYNRSIRCHKLVYEALSRLLWNAFLGLLSVDQHSESIKICERLCELFELGILREELPKNFISLMESFNKFVDEGCKSNATFAFWASYLDMIGCLLNFLRATRSADWSLHLAATEKMIPWFFTYDHVNYARYLPIYLLEMLNLKHTHPTINDQLCSGDFVTKRHVEKASLELPGTRP
ncbi:hypothetical protein JTE90_024708 [Oedothorax gibbosus]|uniref:Uncharacterized protein n=1 Tax=Oedothorax gibbosus TaxID=931172 RepID=A0AAV6U9S2_9ARAC|nr:hypothetical protein JTE90_024708 [Oedothorax gibbosus]